VGTKMRFTIRREGRRLEITIAVEEARGRA
jgi:hypothetical protein